MEERGLSSPGTQIAGLQGYHGRRTAVGVALAGFWIALLAVPQGYFLVPLLLAVGGLYCRRPWQAAMGCVARDRLLVLALVLQGGVWLAAGLWHGEIRHALGGAAATWMALPLLVLLRRLPPSTAWLWAGMALGGVGAGAWALWQRLVDGVLRAHGHEPLHAILFGNLALLTGLSCLAGLVWAGSRARRHLWLPLLAGGAFSGILASLLSGSRGGWIGLPLALLVIYRAQGRRLAGRWRVMALAGLLVVAAGLYAVPQTGVQARVDHAVSSLHRYLQGDEEVTSISARLDLWRGGLALIAERPGLGWGSEGYRAGKAELIEEGELAPELSRFWHAHNDLLDAWVKRGLPGLVALLVLYLTPLRLFAGGIRDACPRQRSLAIAGTLLPVAFMDFGLTYSFLAYAAGLTIYATWLAALWALYRPRPAMA
ncbi:O-antigen ligase family protein [Halomonas nitroreducens]|uniref:O-antigen ligase family protein n=1 Tax=Halomonas nitroreducens TaxID=447425 RepID=A0A3S0KRN8_9GAMM|nr:O-antigen ligase family protein [Halomonas nitroreducens]RTR05022.1 O-antigen ligase family protein [Halomonas nitroreducens]